MVPLRIVSIQGKVLNGKLETSNHESIDELIMMWGEAGIIDLIYF